ncbi:MAG: glycosyltransferase [Candidatus Margulisbacteria bacterium]|nr:glycosyltransferase [Candidatus Margulisiibacteriota bacterium]
MKILHIAPLVKPLPPEGYGGVERVVHWLAKACVEKGHTVYVATLPGSQLAPPYKVIELPLKPVKERYEKQDYVKACKFLAKNLPPDIDIIHGHSAGNIYRTWKMGSGACEIRKHSLLPLLITIHGYDERLPEQKGIGLSFISRSQMQRYGLDQKYIYNPIDMSEYQYCATKENYLLWMSKLGWQGKGLDTAIEIATQSFFELYVAGPGLDRNIEKKLKGKIKYMGEVSGKAKADLFAKASAFLHTATLPEPFGLVLIEAMASGTPALAFNIGATSEVIKSGETGFVCQDKAEMARAISKLDQINPQACQQWVIDNFDSLKITDQYLSLYQEIINNNEH